MRNEQDSAAADRARRAAAIRASVERGSVDDFAPAKRYVVSTCHDGTDWCVRDATDDEVIEGEWVATHEDAVALAARTAEEYGCRYYDFSGGA